MLDDPDRLKELVDDGATFMDVLSYLASVDGDVAVEVEELVVGGADAQSATVPVSTSEDPQVQQPEGEPVSCETGSRGRASRIIVLTSSISPDVMIPHAVLAFCGFPNPLGGEGGDGEGGGVKGGTEDPWNFFGLGSGILW
jgi:hypothetical protein